MADEVHYDKVRERALRRVTRTYRSEYTDRLWVEGSKKGDEGRYTDSFAEEFAEGAVVQARRTLIGRLEVRYSGLTPVQRERIETCGDLEQLDAWIMKLLTRTAAEILGD